MSQQDKRQKKINDLERRKKQIQDQIRKEKKKVSQEKRKIENRRKVLVGAYCLDLLNQGHSIPAINSEEELKQKMDSFLSRDSDRKVFDLAPKPNSDHSQGQSSSSNSTKNKSEQPKADSNEF